MSKCVKSTVQIKDLVYEIGAHFRFVSGLAYPQRFHVWDPNCLYFRRTALWVSVLECCHAVMKTNTNLTHYQCAWVNYFLRSFGFVLMRETNLSQYLGRIPWRPVLGAFFARTCPRVVDALAHARPRVVDACMYVLHACRDPFGLMPIHHTHNSQSESESCMVAFVKNSICFVVAANAIYSLTRCIHVLNNCIHWFRRVSPKINHTCAFKVQVC